MVSMQEIRKEIDLKYKLVPPDGGWGHLVTVSLIVMNIVTALPLTAFGLVYGNFLASLVDETTGTTLVNGIFNTVQSFTGLASSYLLQKYTYRKVGLLGAVLYSIGGFASIFMTSFPQMIVCFGILQGLGFGLMMPASFSAFNCYFDKKLNVMMGIAQAIMVLAFIFFPPVAAFLVGHFGFRGGVAFLACLALLNFPAMGVLQPVEWHMKKISIEMLTINNEIEMDQIKSINEEISRTQTVPLLNKQMEDSILIKSGKSIDSLGSKFRDVTVEPRRGLSVLTLGDRAISVAAIDKLGPADKNSSSQCMDLSLFKDPKYLNISCGIALGFTSDLAFNSIIPSVLHSVHFEKSTIALMMMVFFGSDLVARILISVISALFKIRNRYVFLAGVFFTAVFRIAFTQYNTYAWKLVTLGVLGFLRCFIQTPLALVIAEEYKDNFSTAFSLYMVVCGFTSLIFGALMSFVKSVTKSDEMVIHVLTLGLLLCSFSWMIELLWANIKEHCFRRKSSNS